MFRRPHAGETDDDITRQEEELLARGEFQPSAKLVRADKRKTEDLPSHRPPGMYDCSLNDLCIDR